MRSVGTDLAGPLFIKRTPGERKLIKFGLSFSLVH